MAADITAGQTNTVVIDGQRQYWMAGKVRPSLFVLTLVLTTPCSGRTQVMVSFLREHPTLCIVLIQFRLGWAAVFFLPLLPGFNVGLARQYRDASAADFRSAGVYT